MEGPIWSRVQFVRSALIGLPAGPVGHRHHIAGRSVFAGRPSVHARGELIEQLHACPNASPFGVTTFAYEHTSPFRGCAVRPHPADVHPTFTFKTILATRRAGTLTRVFEALSNFRDLGGHVTADGRTLRSGLVYRSDALCFVTDHDRALLRDTLCIRTIVDLRTSMEHERMGRYDLADVGEVVHLPVLDGALIREKAHDGSLDLFSMYRAIVFDHAGEISAVLTLLADRDRLPAVISCTAGKDRTGIVVGVLLAVLGVPDETILADYEQSTAGVAMLRSRIMARLVGDDVPNIPPAAFAVEPAALAEVLQEIRTRYGTVTAYLIAAGAPVEIEQRLGALLDDSAEEARLGLLA